MCASVLARIGRRTLLAAIGSGCLTPATTHAQQQAVQPPIVFGSAVEMVRIDAVVLDRDGRPVSGLAAADFAVEEGGKPQAITSFEAVVVRGPQRHLVAADEPPRLSAARIRAPSEGRCVLLFIDDIHLTPPVAEPVRAALRKFIATDVREGDWVTLVAPEQQLWWTARNGWEYRQLGKVVSQVKGHGRGDSFADWSAVRAEEDGPGNAGIGVDEVVARVKRQTGITLAGLQQALESLVNLRGKKSLVLISEGFLLLRKMPGYQETIDLARRAHVAIHFLDPRGVQVGVGGAVAIHVGVGGPGADSAAAAMAGHVGPGTQLALTLGDVEGIAQVTGGTVFSGNEPEAGLRRIVSESDAYYLLGYEPAQPGGGEREVKVRVKREALTVRARTRYFVQANEPTPAKPDKSAKEQKLTVQTSPELAALRSLSDTTDLPLRAATHFYEPNHKGEITVTLATEAVPPPGTAGERLYKVLSEARSRGGGAPVRDQFEARTKVTPGASLILARQWYLKPGVWQVKLLVEDTEAKRFGSLVHTFEVPDAKSFRISTPILTAEIEDPDGKRRPKLALGRTFRSGSVMYCQYSVYGAPVAGDWGPHVVGSWQLKVEETVIREVEPTMIQPTPDGRLTRTLGINLQGLLPAEYSLLLTVRDEKTGETVRRSETFTVAP